MENARGFDDARPASGPGEKENDIRQTIKSQYRASLAMLANNIRHVQHQSGELSERLWLKLGLETE